MKIHSSTRPAEDVDNENDATDDFISKDGQIDNEPLWVPAKITSNDNVLLVGRLVNFFVQIAGV